MKARYFILSMLIGSAAARADFSYVMSSKGGPGAPSETKQYLKGEKMKTETSGTSIILDFDAQTFTTLNTSQKTYTVQKFSDLGKDLAQSGAELKVDVKETGQKKTINGFNASQLTMSMLVDSPAMQKQGMKMQLDMEIWISPDVPGSGEMMAFYQRNLNNFPWSSMGGAATPEMRSAMFGLQKKLATMSSVSVLQVMHIKAIGGPAQAQAQAAQSDPRMAQARVRLEEMAKGGGPGADIAKQQLARMGGATGGSAFGMDITMESGNFSINPISDSVFEIPAGYRQTEK